MYKFLTRNGQVLAFGLGILITILFLVTVFSGLDEFNGLAEDQKGTTSIFNLGLGSSIFLVIAGFAAIIIFGLIQVFGDLKGSMVGLGGFAAILAIFFIARGAGGDDTAIADTISKFQVSESESGIISGAISTGLALAALAAITFVLSEIRNFFK